MNNAEATALCRLVAATCPHQRVDEFTPDAWAGLLDDVRFEDARDALRAIAKRQPFVAPAEIRAEVHRLRRDRVESAGVLSPPPGLDPDDETAYRRWLRAERRSIGDGNPPTPAVSGTRPMPALEAFHDVDDA